MSSHHARRVVRCGYEIKTSVLVKVSVVGDVTTSDEQFPPSSDRCYVTTTTQELTSSYYVTRLAAEAQRALAGTSEMFKFGRQELRSFAEVRQGGRVRWRNTRWEIPNVVWLYLWNSGRNWPPLSVYLKLLFPSGNPRIVFVFLQSLVISFLLWLEHWTFGTLTFLVKKCSIPSSFKS